MTGLRFWLRQVAVALDQLFNALIGGWADETLSACAWRMERQGKPWGRIWRPLIDTLFFFQPSHCEGAWNAERERLQSPPEER